MLMRKNEIVLCANSVTIYSMNAVFLPLVTVHVCVGPGEELVVCSPSPTQLNVAVYSTVK